MSFISQIQRPFAIESISRKCVLVFCATALLALASQASIPWTPVPLTFQSVTVVAIGLFCGAQLGFSSVVLYLLAGFFGLPVFADGASGPLVFFGPTAGYLLGFAPAAYLSGVLVEKGFAQGLISTFFCALLGVLPIFLGGICILSLFIGVKQAYLLGVKPFLFTELAKIFIVSVFSFKFWKNIRT